MSDQSIYYVLLVGCLLLAVGVSVAAWRRPDTRRRAARLLAGLLAVAGLWLMAYPPQRTVAEPQAEAILLTDGYQPDTLRALLGRFGARTRVWRFSLSSSQPTSADTPTVSSLTTVREQMPTLRRLHLLGRGLPSAVLPALGAVRLVQHGSSPYVGFRNTHWNRTLEVGQPLLLEGYFASLAARKPGPTWVRLQVAGATRDSVRLPAGHGAFRLRYVPKTAGRMVATVSAGPSRQLLAKEPVPVEVVPTRPLRVLLLAVTPSFELKFLKNHLAARQHAVAWRAGISRGLTQTEFSNQPTTDLSRLTPTLLARYDVLVTEASALAALPAAEAQTLRAAQRTAGLGIVVLAESAALPAVVPGRTEMRLVVQNSSLNRPQRINWPDAPPASTLVPGTLTLAGVARPLVTLASSGAAVVASQRIGLGNVVISTLPETYAWLLQNASSTYESYWSRVLSAAARPAAPTTRWTLVDPWPRPQLPLPLRLSGSFPTQQPVVAGATNAPLARLPLQQDPALPEWSTTTYWPTAPGWHQLQLSGQPTQWFYVFAASDWQGPELQRRSQSAIPWLTTAAEPLPALERTEPWPVGWFFALFVLAAGFLWLEEKL
ncbi:hypothetical protein [Hymenobacter sp. YC55]|uniref:hypothetical protein n=1 Tax=Hymenobacter sp. YC55 TaxID=3034019 RepID=UPI0023F7A112|nr:hypothetical protein [Hymenobacter sp. YC55]MDF7809855.1 hypothetical protein [Hymenobacter sp. YC55]